MPGAQDVDDIGQYRACTRVELAFHEVPGRVDDGDVDTSGGEPACRLQPEEPAAEDGERRAGAGHVEDGEAVVEVPESDDAGPRHSGDRRQPGSRAGREDEVVIGQEGAVGEGQGARGRTE